jgi:diadenosine tetraphosphate (Ap4A) HIT family hydrolase
MDRRDGCPLCGTDAVPASRLIHGDRLWRVVHEPDPVVVPGKLYVTLQRHAESPAELTDDEAAALGPLLARVVAAVERETGAPRVHVGSYGEQVRHVHFHVTPRPAHWPKGNAPMTMASDLVSLLVRLRLRRPVPPADVDDLVDRLRRRREAAGP